MNKLENEVLSKLLEGDHTELVELRRQLSLASVKSREMTGVGFFLEFELPDEVMPTTLPPRATFGDVIAQVPCLKHGIGFIIFLDDNGRLDFLEGYTFGEDWPDELNEWTLSYLSEERDYSTLIPK